ncbi:MAG: heavy metal-associated domain-containing protein [Eubacteriales bacterium]|nr:heavy metal-associated domain-containing protein [Eubacteriales bacterium]
MIKKKYRLEHIDCAGCAAKMETAINKLPGVSAAVNFFAQSLVLEMERDEFDSILPQIQNIISRIEPDCRIAAR